MAITFHNADVQFKMKQSRKTREYIYNQVQKGKKQIKKIIYVFCSDEYLLDINRQFLKHDYFTDIITFPLNSDPDSLEAEIYISIDRVRENAFRFAIEGKKKGNNLQLLFEQELLRVIFHGILHLLGFKDKTRNQQQQMRRLEDAWLKGFAKFNT